VLYNAPAQIVIPFSQLTVTYQLKDDSGAINSKRITREGNAILIETKPLIKDDYTFSVIATKTGTTLTKQLLQTVVVTAGVNNALEVLVTKPAFAYGSIASVIVKGAQPGAKYQLFDKQEVAVSEEYSLANGGDIELFTTQPVTEDITLIVWATSIKTGYYDQLLTRPEILVLPDTSIVPALKHTTVAHKGKADIVIENSQKSSEYQLVFVNIDADTIDKEPYLELGEPVKGNGKTIHLPVNNCREDLVLKVIATKIKSRQQVELPASIVVPVHPDPEKEIEVVTKDVKAGENAIIKVHQTQKGIIYQLQNGNDQDVGLPQYHHKNYGIGKARLEVEFVVDLFENDFVELHTGPLTETTSFKVVAIKATTKLTALVGTVTVTVT
jgi:hypothetical protein